MSDITNIICPICSGYLKEEFVGPCFDCGCEPREIEEYQQGYHQYNIFLLWEEELVLCDFCEADFDSYYPEYFGLPKNPGVQIDYHLQFIGKFENPVLSKDLYCSNCKHKLAFLEFLSKVRVRNAV